MGLIPQNCGRAGVIAVIDSENQRKVFLLRADKDAFSIAEKSGADFAASNGRMYACGYDMHTAMLLCAA